MQSLHLIYPHCVNKQTIGEHSVFSTLESPRTNVPPRSEYNAGLDPIMVSGDVRSNWAWDAGATPWGSGCTRLIFTLYKTQVKELPSRGESKPVNSPPTEHFQI